MITQASILWYGVALRAAYNWCPIYEASDIYQTTCTSTCYAHSSTNRCRSSLKCEESLRKSAPAKSLYKVLATASSSGMMSHLPIVMCLLQNRQIHSQVLILPAVQQLLNRRVAVQSISQAGHTICD